MVLEWNNEMVCNLPLIYDFIINSNYKPNLFNSITASCVHINRTLIFPISMRTPRPEEHSLLHSSSAPLFLILLQLFFFLPSILLFFLSYFIFHSFLPSPTSQFPILSFFLSFLCIIIWWTKCGFGHRAIIKVVTGSQRSEVRGHLPVIHL